MGNSETVRLLRRLEEGDDQAAEELLPLIYQELRSIAGRLMAGERKAHTLQATALVHEAWMRLLGGSEPGSANRQHFLRLAARAMRRVLVDHARAKRADKRGGGKAPQPLDEALAAYEDRPEDLLALDEALTRLGEKDEELLRIVELRYFAGLTLEETAEQVGKTVRQVHLAWGFARGWLKRELSKGTH
ncbi:MAG: sigma-70 family RNA polymerase sigma factor [Candidatus Latescibacteria bacterium]|nr:sigma-70 family RNA polymerase sigma factor [Candidatus Latescibacterota bacterium]